MKIPKQLKIRGLTYTVEEMKDKFENNDFYGRSWTREQKIKVSSDIKQDRKELCFFHELFHVILDESGFTEVSKNEQIIECLSHDLYQILNDSNLLNKGR